jgi:hypothetical protein
LGLSSSSRWASGERNNRPETDNRSHQSTPGDRNPRLWSNTLAYSDTIQSHRSSVSHWSWEPNQVAETLFMNLQLPEWLQIKPHGYDKVYSIMRFCNLQTCSTLLKSIKTK